MLNISKSALCIVGCLLLVAILTSCLKEESINRPFTGFAPVPGSDGWELATPEEERLDSTALAEVYSDLYAYSKAWSLKSMLVIRNGRLVAGSYTKEDNDRIDRNALWSCTKQLTGIMAGHGGQYAVIYPEKQLVVIITALEQVDDDISIGFEEISEFSDRIADLCK